MATIETYKDPVEKVQKGVQTTLPVGGPSFRWNGRLSLLLEGGCACKLAKGFKPTRYTITASPIENPNGFSAAAYPAAAGYKDTFLEPGDAVAISAATKTSSDGGKTFATGGTGGVAFSNATLTAAAPKASGTLAEGATVADDESYVVFTAVPGDPEDSPSPSESGDATVQGDCWIEVVVYADQIDPEPEKMF